MATPLIRRLPKPEPRFRLQLERDPLGRPVLVVLQRRVGRRGATAELTFEPVVRAAGLALEVAMPMLTAAVRACGTAPERLLRPPRAGEPPVELDEAAGARVALTLFALRPLRKLQRMEAIARGVAGMSNEEALYWFARVMQGPRARTLRALRILLAKE